MLVTLPTSVVSPDLAITTKILHVFLHPQADIFIVAHILAVSNIYCTSRHFMLQMIDWLSRV